MATRMGLLVAGFDYSPVAEDEFNDWYDTEHVPERSRIKGFVNCERWLGTDDPKISIATYDLQSPAVLESAEYRAIAGPNLSPWSKRVTARCRRICRFEAEQILPGHQAAPHGAGALLLYAMNVESAFEVEFNNWYDHEHAPALAAVPGCLSARRFRIHQAVSHGNHRYLALYHLTAPEVCSSGAWKKAAETPWTVKLRPHMKDRLRLTLRRYHRKA
jgi:hypothetical protein